MKTWAMIALALVVLVGCGKIKEEEDALKGPLGSKTEKDTTARDSCGLTEPAGSSIFRGTWKVFRLSAKNVHIQETLRFEPAAVTQTVICTYDGQSVTSSARGSASVSAAPHEFIITAGDKQEKVLNVGSETHTCKAELKAFNESMKYQFRGPCLSLQVTAEDELVYVPN
ncbi:MAG: hypothetical protein ACXWC9_03680 [Pseudobdellovibrionaceae bacterium]